MQGNFDIDYYNRYNTRIFVPSESINGTPVTGAISDLISNNLTQNRALVSSSLGKIIVSNILDTELDALDDIDGNIQDQLDAKQDALTLGDLSELTSDILTIDGINSVIGGATITVKQATSSQDGYLSAADWTAFNSKPSAVLPNSYIYVGSASDLAAAVPVTGDVLISDLGVVTISDGVIIDSQISSIASISLSKLSPLNGNVVAVTNSSGYLSSSAVTDTKLGYISNLTGDAQDQLNDRLIVTLGSQAQGDLIQYSGSEWTNYAIGAAGYIWTSDGSIGSWQPGVSNGIPSGGTSNQVLRKIDGTDYNTEWHTSVLADLTDVTASFDDVNILAGASATISSVELGYLDGLLSNAQTQISSKQTRSLAYNAIWVGNGANIASEIAPGTNGDIFTMVGTTPQWQTPTPPGDVSGPVSSTDNAIVRWNTGSGDSIQDSGIIIDDSNNITGIASLTATDISTATTIGSAYIYRVGGTDVSLSDGGTGASLADPGANRLWGWDDTDNAIKFITIGSNLSYDHATHTLSATGGGGGGSVNSVAGTTNRISISGPSTDPVIDISATYVGQSSITTLGTITIGVWTGTAIGDTYISSAATWNAKQAALSGTGIVKSTIGTISYINGTAGQFIKGDGSLDASVYLTANETITLSGDVSGSGTTSISTTLATVNSNVGTFGSSTESTVFTVNGKGLITAVSNTTVTPAASSITGGAALTKTDDTNITVTLGGTPASSLLAATSLTLGWTGTLAYSRFVNGTGLSVVGRAANSAGVQADIVGTNNQVLRVSGTTLGFGSIDLSQSATVGSSQLPIANGGTGGTVGAWLLSGTSTLTGSTTIAASTSTLLFTSANTAGSVTAFRFAPTVTGTVATGETVVGFEVDTTFAGTLTSDTATAFRIRVAGVNALSISNVAAIAVGGAAGGPLFAATSSAQAPSLTGTSLFFQSGANWGGANRYGAQFATKNNNFAVAGQAAFLYSVSNGDRTWLQTGGSNDFTFMRLNPDWEITAGTNTLRIIDYLPVETNLAGATVRYGITIGGTDFLNGFGTRTPTARVHITAGSATIAPLKINKGTLVTTIAAGVNDGAIEYDTSTNHFYATIGSTRYQLDQQSGLSGLTNTQVLFATGASTLAGDSEFTYNSSTNLITIDSITIGRGAGGLLTNTVMGNAALSANNTGTLHVAFGYEALKLSENDQANSAFGDQALGTVNGGSYNVAFGYHAGKVVTTGNFNTFIGTDNSSSGGVTTGSNNIFIGYQNSTNTGVTTGSGNIIIGNGVTGLSSSLADTIIFANGLAGSIRYRDDGVKTLLNNGILAIENTTNEPVSALADCVELYSVDDSSQTTLGIRTEKSVGSDAAAISTHSFRIKINGTVYHMMLHT